MPIWSESYHLPLARELHYRCRSSARAAVTDASLARELPLQMPLCCESCDCRWRSGATDAAPVRELHENCHYRCRSGPRAAITDAALVRELCHYRCRSGARAGTADAVLVGI